jgi:hypothetical protein
VRIHPSRKTSNVASVSFQYPTIVSGVRTITCPTSPGGTSFSSASTSRSATPIGGTPTDPTRFSPNGGFIAYGPVSVMPQVSIGS